MRSIIAIIFLFIFMGCKNGSHEKSMDTVDSLKAVTYAYHQILSSLPEDSIRYYQAQLNSQTLSIKTNMDSVDQQKIFGMAPAYFQLNGQFSFLIDSQKALLEIALKDIQRLSEWKQRLRDGSAMDPSGHPLDDQAIEEKILNERIHTDSLTNACLQLNQNITQVIEKARLLSPLVQQKILSPLAE